MSVGSKDGLQCENQSCGELSKKLCVYKSTSYILMLMENRRELEHPWNVSAFHFLAFRILYPGPVPSSQLDRAFPLLPHEQRMPVWPLWVNSDHSSSQNALLTWFINSIHFS